jgi:DNA polymerase-3 subunit gamma/tau
MAYEIFARKYRPATFDEVVGQDPIARTLLNAVANQRVAPVYIFAGSHGVGKTSMARILAKALNCASPNAEGAPCGSCEVCLSIANGEALDVIEIDGASNRGIDEARKLRDGVYYRPASFRWKVYILDEFHQLSKDAFDALLKTFEEAPEHVVFILATTELHRVPDTIKSRAQTFQFRRASLDQVKARLAQIAEKENLKVEDEALEIVARRSRGSLRDSQKLFDQVVALSAGAELITAASLGQVLGFVGSARILDSLRALSANQAAILLDIVHELYEGGSDPQVYVSDLLEGLRGPPLPEGLRPRLFALQ